LIAAVALANRAAYLTARPSRWAPQNHERRPGQRVDRRNPRARSTLDAATRRSINSKAPWGSTITLPL
jgi:hypothetical protein